MGSKILKCREITSTTKMTTIGFVLRKIPQFMAKNAKVSATKNPQIKSGSKDGQLIYL